MLDYAPEGSGVRGTLQARLQQLEAVSRQRQEDLLASLLGDSGGTGAGGKVGAGGKQGKVRRGAAGHVPP